MKTIKGILFAGLLATMPLFAQDLSLKTELFRSEYLDTTPTERYKQITEKPKIREKSVFVLGSFFEYPETDYSLCEIKTQNPAEYFVRAFKKKVELDRFGMIDVFSNREKNDYDENQGLLKDYIRPKFFDALYGTSRHFNKVVKLADSTTRTIKDRASVKFKTEDGRCFSLRPYVNGLEELGAQLEMKRFCGSDLRIRLTTERTIFGIQFDLGKIVGVFEAKFPKQNNETDKQVYLFYLTTK